VLAQTLLMMLLKTAQKKGTYAFSPAAAICLVEVVKFFLATADLVRVIRSEEGRAGYQAPREESVIIYRAQRTVTPRLVASLAVLAVAYAANNQLQFTILTYLEPGVLHLLKSTSTLVTALIRTLLMGAAYSQHQWVSLALQVLGVSLVKLDGCTEGLSGAPAGIALMAVSVLITASCSVWNEALLKGDATPMPLQNMIMYLCGAVINFASYVQVRPLSAFFSNFDLWAVLIIFAYSCVGLAVTACYKYADAVLKTLSSGVATILLLVYGMLVLGTRMTVIQSVGTATTLLATYAYTIAPPVAAKPPTLPVATELRDQFEGSKSGGQNSGE
jgi:drug/metabolite transporter (DMT)-like permease